MTSNELTEEERDALEAPNRSPKTQDELDYLNYQRIEHEAAARENFIQEQHNKQNIERQKEQDELQDQLRREALEEFGILIPQVTTEDADNFEVLNIPRDDSVEGKDARAEKILSIDPMTFLLNDLKHRIEGDTKNIKLILLSFMSMHPKISTLLHQQIIGQSGGGKSYLVFECRKLLTPTHTLPWTELSPKAINYYCAGNEDTSPQTIANKLLFLDDATEKDIPLLKTLGNNDGSRPSGMVVYDGGNLEYQWDGYPLTIISKVSPLEDEGGQISSRYLTYNIEESPEHTNTILEKQRVEEVSNIGRIEMDPVCQFIMFKCLTLPINRIQLCQYDFPPDITSRNHKFYQALIKCNAILNHKNRIITDGILHTSPTDVTEASALWEHISIYNNEKLSKISIDILSILKPKNEVRGRESTISGLSEILHSSNPTVTKYLDKMVRVGTIGYTSKNPKVFYIL